MSVDEPSTPDAELQFDRAVAAGEPNAGAAEQGVVCAVCGTTIRTAYFSAGSATLCGSCKVKLEMGEAASRRWPTFGRAALFGLGATVAGASLYAAVIAITGYEIGLIAIATGYMVGWAVNQATRGYGARRFQVLALSLTYLSVGLAYTPIAIKGAAEGSASKTAADAARAVSADSAGRDRADSGHAAASDSPAATKDTAVSAEPIGSTDVLKFIGLLIFFALALPVMVVVGSLPSGLLSALIIAFGMRQAWRMAGDMRPTVTGPLRVGAAPTAPAV